MGSGLLSMSVCINFRSTNVVQLSNRNPYFYRFWCHHPLITQLKRVCLQYLLTIYPGSTLWKMCANLDTLVLKIRQYYDKPPTISHIFILQWTQNIYDVEIGFLWHFRKTLSFDSIQIGTYILFSFSCTTSIRYITQ